MRIFMLLAALLFGQEIFSQPVIEIINPASFDRTEEVIEIPWNRIMETYPKIDTAQFKVIQSKTGKELEFQLEYKGSHQIQNLLVLVDVPANGKTGIQLVKGKRPDFVSKTYCRFVPERKDDFAWENDRIAFRMYGKALERTPAEMAYGIDVWVKRTHRLILNERYAKGEYHVDHGDGLDYYHVGLTLGAGGIAPYINDTIWFSKNYAQWKVLDNGPLRSTFRLDYEEWVAAGRKVNIIKTISIDAGSQMSKMDIQFKVNDQQPLPVVAGIIRRKEAGTMLLNEKEGILGYWEPTHGNDGTTGVGCVLPAPVAGMKVTKEHLLAELKLNPPHSLVYYTGAAWDKAGTITNAQQWFDYLTAFQQKLDQPLQWKVR